MASTRATSFIVQKTQQQPDKAQDLSLLRLIAQTGCTSEKKQHLWVIDGLDTQDMRESRERYLDDLHGVGSRVGAAAACMEGAAPVNEAGARSRVNQI
jgi:hypothetical protein